MNAAPAAFAPGSSTTASRQPPACRVCGGSDTRIFFELPSVPVQDGLLFPSEKAARESPIGDIRLAFCGGCGFIGNVAFEPEKVKFEQGYDISLHHSPRYREFIEELAARLVQFHGLRGKTILEIACGNGDFLRTLCRRGANRGTGFDPSLRAADIASSAAEGVTLVPEAFRVREGDPPADLVCCRHVLQSIPEPRDLLAMVRDASRDVYFEMSNAAVIFRDLVIWTIIYETCSYYTAPSLTRLFELSGFRVQSAAPCFDGQYLGIDARYLGPPVAESASTRQAIQELRHQVADFERRFQDLRARWTAEIEGLRRDRRRVAGWGAGGRAISFLNLFGIGPEIPYVVDINPKRQGLHLPVTAQRVVAPEFLREYRPEVVLITNPAFEAEIRAQVRGLGLACEFRVL